MAFRVHSDGVYNKLLKKGALSLAVAIIASLASTPAAFAQTCTPMDLTQISTGTVGPTTLADQVSGELFRSTASATPATLVGSNVGDIGAVNNGNSITFVNTQVGSATPKNAFIYIRSELDTVQGYLGPEIFRIASNRPLTVNDPHSLLNVTVIDANTVTITSAAAPQAGSPNATWSITTTASQLTVSQIGGGDPYGSINVSVGCTQITADLVTVKTLASGNATPHVGDVVRYQIAVNNNGPAKGTNVRLTDLLPTSLTATAGNGTVSQGTYNATTGLWNIGTLAVGGTATLTLEGTVKTGQAGNTITNTTTATTADQADPTNAGNDLSESVTVRPRADFSIKKTNTPGVNGDADQANDTVVRGATTTYRVTVTNNGGDPVSGAVVTDTPGAGITCAAGNPVTITGAGVPTGSFTIGNLTTGGITLGTLSSGQSTVLTYSCVVN